jgi:hypothetical protein
MPEPRMSEPLHTHIAFGCWTNTTSPRLGVCSLGFWMAGLYLEYCTVRVWLAAGIEMARGPGTRWLTLGRVTHADPAKNGHPAPKYK